MIGPGDVLENPGTGEVLRVLEARDDLARWEVTLRPGGGIAAEHLHPRQEERYRIVAGELRMLIGGREVVAAPGDELVSSPGTPHRFWNATDADVVMVNEVRPAGRTLELFATLSALARDGRAGDDGLPQGLALFGLAHRHRHDVRLASPPGWVQALVLPVLARVAAWRGVVPPPLEGQPTAR